MNNPLPTRYPGLASFTTAQKDIFFGRKQESRDLTNLIAVERTVVLFSKSGYGKTSLLQAGVMPQLYGQQIVPVPIRFGTDVFRPEFHFEIQFEAAWRKFHGETLPTVLKKKPSNQGDSGKKLGFAGTFWEQIARCPFGQQPAQFTPLFIFDQFEELFTLYPEPEKRHRFITELADLIHERLPADRRERLLADLDAGKITPAEAARLETAPPMKFIFSIRSDMLHFMDELSEQIPYILRSRYQLFGLNEAQATEAIERPAALPGDFASPRFGFEAAAMTEILEVLGKNREVESFQLQAVCQAIEEKIMRGGRQKFDPIQLLAQNAEGLPMIDSEFYGGRSGIDDILEASYNRRLDSLADQHPDWPNTARRLLEDALVNKNERRQSVDVVEIRSRPSVTQALLDELERQRLVRKEPRLDSFYYEISHDTWLAPVLKSRRARLAAEEKQMLELRAETERLQKEKAQAERRRARLVAAGGFLLAALAVVAAVFAFLQSREAKNQETAALFQKKQADSLLVIAQNNQRLADDKTVQVEKEKNATEAQRQEAMKNFDAAKKARANAEFQLAVNILKSTKKFPENFDILIPLDSLDCLHWNLGSLSPEFGKLVNLKKLNLEINQLSSLPEQIGNLKNLTSLNLENNQLRSLPEQIGNLKNLTSLDLFNNKLSSLPEQIGNLKNLTSLVLSLNQLSSLPEQIGNLQNLTRLYLYFNQLSSLPAQIGNLKNLIELILADNQLSSLPGQIGNLKNLKELNLYHNKLVSLPEAIGNLKNLIELDLEDNQLSSLPEQIGNLKNLKKLVLIGNPLPETEKAKIKALLPNCVIIF